MCNWGTSYIDTVDNQADSSPYKNSGTETDNEDDENEDRTTELTVKPMTKSK